MAVLKTDEKQFEYFIADVENIIANLTDKASDGDIAGIEKLLQNFKMKTEDFFRENRKLNIGVVGQVKAGKSSFLNTLLFDGKEILPKASTPKTATLTKMQYSENNIIEIEYYLPDEWKVLEDNSRVDLDDEVYTSAREIIDMARRNGIEPREYLDKGTEQIKFDTYDNLIEHLNDYVGEDGKFTPIVKSVTLYLNKEEFEGLSIVDTPGLNDPIASRTIRTKEFIEVCDVVFFLSQSGSFLDKSDWTLLSSQLPQKGVKKLVLVASKYDSGIRDVLRKDADDDDDFGGSDNFASDIPKACKIIRSKLKDRAKQKVAEFVKDLEQRSSTPELIEVIKQCSKPVLASAMAHNMSKKPPEEYTPEERNVYSALSQFSDDIQSDLRLLGNFDKINELFDDVVAEKEQILEKKAREFIPNALEELRGLLELYKEKAQKRLLMIEKNDRDALVEQKKSIGAQIDAVKADISTVFGELNSRIEQKKAEGVKELRDISKDYLDIKERQGTTTRVESYRVSDSTWYKPWTWGKSHTEHYTVEEHYSYCLASDAVENIRKYSFDAVNTVEEVFTESINIKELKRKLLNVVVNDFDTGSEKYDSSLFRIMVEETVSSIEFPVFKLDVSDFINSITAKFSGELTSASEKNNLSETLSATISKVLDKVSSSLSEKASEFKSGMSETSKRVQNILLENINKEFEILITQCEDKEKEIAAYKAYIEALEGELVKIR